MHRTRRLNPILALLVCLALGQSAPSALGVDVWNAGSLAYAPSKSPSRKRASDSP